MRGALVVTLLVGVMLGVARLRGAVSEDVVDALTFAAVGFVVLAAHALADLVGRLKLPRVSGYILAGIALGPQLGGLLTVPVVEQMKVFNTLALALIALEAGLELEVHAIKRVAKSLGAMMLVKTLLTPLFVGAVFFFASGLLPPEMRDSLSTQELIAIALVLSALAVGTSPAVSVAVISEARAKGRVAELVLAIAVAKDVLMIVLLAIATAIGKGLVDPEATLELSVLGAVFAKVLLSLAAGGVLGGVLVLWLRFVRWELVLVLLVLGYGVNTLSDVLHLKMLLVFIAAGFTVTNFSRYGHDLHKPLQLLATPVFVVFFTTVGAGLDLQAALAVLPIGLVLFASRGAMMALAARLGARLAGDPPEFGRRVWLGFISQAGVALGLLLIARADMPSLDGPLGQVGTVLISLNLLIGPVLLRKALGDGAAPGTAAPDAAAADEPDDGPSSTAAPLWQPAPATEPPPLPEAALAESHRQVSALLGTLVEQLDAAVVGPWAEAAHTAVRELSEPVEAPTGDDQAAPLLAPRSTPVDRYAQRIWVALNTLRDALDALPNRLDGSVRAVHRHGREHDSALLRARLAAFAVRTRLGGKRPVPARDAARSRVEGTVVPELADFLAHVARLEARRLARSGALRTGQLRGAEGQGTVLEREDEWIDRHAGRLRERLAAMKARASARYAEALAFAASPRLPRGRLSFRRVAADVDQALGRLATEGRRWDRALDAIAGRATVDLTLAALDAALGQEVAKAVTAWRGRHQSLVSSRLDQALESLEATRASLTALASEATATRESLSKRLAQETRALDDLIAGELLPAMRASRTGGGEGVASPLDAINRRIEALLGTVAEEVASAASDLDLDGVASPDDIAIGTVQLRAIARQHLAAEMAWLDDAREDAEHLVDRAVQRLGEVAGITTYGLQLATSQVEPGPGPQMQQGDVLEGPDATQRALAVAIDAVDRAGRLVRALRDELEEAELVTALSIESTLQDALGHVGRLARDERPGRALRRRRWLHGVRTSTARGWRRLVIGLSQLVAYARRLTSRLASSELARDARVRAGVDRLDVRAMSVDLKRLGVGVEQAGRVPYVLAQLFDPSTFDLAQAPVRTRREIGRLEAIWRRWQGGTPTAVLLTGPSGSGKTSVARMTLRKAVGRQLLTVVLTPDARTEAGFVTAIGATIGAYDVGRLDELEAALTERSPVLLVDGFEHLFCRTPEGLTHVRRVLSLIAATRHRVCWVVSVPSPTAGVLERLTELSRWFTDHLDFGALDQEALGHLVDARCRLSGFTVAWPRPVIHGDQWWRKLARGLRGRGPEERRRLFYKGLHQASGGHVRDALALWMNAVERVDDDIIHLRPVAAPSLAWFDQLGRSAHLLLALIVECGAVDRDEAASMLRWPRYRVDAALAALGGAGFVARGEGGRFGVWRPAWRRVAALLHERRLLVEIADVQEHLSDDAGGVL